MNLSSIIIPSGGVSRDKLAGPAGRNRVPASLDTERQADTFVNDSIQIWEMCDGLSSDLFSACERGTDFITKSIPDLRIRKDVVYGIREGNRNGI